MSNVETVDGGIVGWAAREVRVGHPPDHRITRVSMGVGSRFVQRTLVFEAELFGDRRARRVVRGASDLDAVDGLGLEGDLGECCRRFRGVAAAGVGRPDPVADLSHPGPSPDVQTGPSDDGFVVLLEDAEDEVAVIVEGLAGLPDE